jgi:hypothetical protein
VLRLPRYSYCFHSRHLPCDWTCHWLTSDPTGPFGVARHGCAHWQVARQQRQAKEAAQAVAARRKAQESRLKASGMVGGTRKLMGGADVELLNPKNRYSVWKKSVDFATFYKWYMRDPRAQQLRLRAPLESTWSRDTSVCTTLFEFTVDRCQCPLGVTGILAGTGTIIGH